MRDYVYTKLAAMEKNWVIIFLVYADFFEEDTRRIRSESKISRELENLFNDIRNTPLQEGCTIYTVVNSIRYKGQTQTKTDRTFVHKVIRPANDGPGSMEEILAIDLDNTLQKKDQLVSILSLINQREPHSRIFLNTWDHGSVFGINQEGRRTGFVEVNSTISIDSLIMPGSHVLNEPFPDSFTFLNTIFTIDNKDRTDFTDTIKKNRFYETTVENNNSLVFEIEKLSVIFRSDKDITKSFESVKSFPDSSGNQTFRFEVNKSNHDLLAGFLKEHSIETPDNLKVIDKDGTVFTLESFTGEVKDWIDVLKNPRRSFTININSEMELLTNKELADAIKESFPGNTVEVLMMMNCNMMNVHSMSAFNGSANFLVAPESGINEPGYNYCAILSAIRPGMTALDLATRCVETFNIDAACGQQTCIDHRTRFNPQNKSVSLFAAELNGTNVTSMVEALNTFALTIKSKISPPAKSIFRTSVLQTVPRCTLQSNVGRELHLFDIDEWLDFYGSKLISQVDFAPVKDLIAEDIQSFRTTIQDHKNSIIRSEQQNGKKFSSFAIFFPVKNVSSITSIGPFIQPVKEGKEEDPLTGWLDFLNHFFS
jgi:hypothetical protein